MKTMLQPAVDELLTHPHLIQNLGRIGVVANQASTTSGFLPSLEVIDAAAKRTCGSTVTCVFGPQHGYRQTEQDNMRETPDDYYVLPDRRRIPLFSLYSQTREPLDSHLENVDTLIVDLSDIGCRVYTYMLTLAGCLRRASLHQKKVIVLDRPNPLGLAYCDDEGTWQRVEGNRLLPRWHSFVGWYDLPMRHGLSMGELGHYFIAKDKLTVEYKVIPVKNLYRTTSTALLKTLPWVMPSPNIPCWESAFFFPAFVVLEGTNISEGRGTTIPFQLVGAPWLNTEACLHFLLDHKHQFIKHKEHQNSLIMRPHSFRPTFNKHVGQICRGIQFHLNSAQTDFLNLFSLGMTFLHFCATAHSEDFQWSSPGYEYNFTDLPVNLILGQESWLEAWNQPHPQPSSLEDLSALLAGAQKEACEFMTEAEKFFIYSSH